MDEDAAPSREDEVLLYMATLEARMDPEQFRVLAALVVEASTLESEAVLPSAVADGWWLVTPDILGECLVVMGIAATGRMDLQVVNLGHGVTTAVTEDIATDPDQMRALRAWAAEHPEI